MANLIHTERPITENEFLNFDEKFNNKIPDSFKNHYIHNNGRFPDENDVEAGKWGFPVNGFYSIKYGNMTIEQMIDDCGDLIPGDQKFKSWKKFEYIPFAYDSGGNMIFVSHRK